MFGLSIFFSIKGQVTVTALHFWQPSPSADYLSVFGGFERKKWREALSGATKKP
jgi:hypothetical protein